MIIIEANLFSRRLIQQLCPFASPDLSCVAIKAAKFVFDNLQQRPKTTKWCSDLNFQWAHLLKLFWVYSQALCKLLFFVAHHRQLCWSKLDLFARFANLTVRLTVVEHLLMETHWQVEADQCFLLMKIRATMMKLINEANFSPPYMV